MSKELGPTKRDLERFLARGLTQAQIVDEWERETGVRVARATIGMAISRHGLSSSKPRPTYSDELPWKIRSEHQNNHNARMLRLWGRRNRGESLSCEQERWLDAYLANLETQGLVVTYVPELEDGFVWMPRRDDDSGPIRLHWRS